MLRNCELLKRIVTCTCSFALAQEAPQLQQQWGKLFRASGGRLICGTCEDQASLSSVSWGEGGENVEDGRWEGWVGLWQGVIAVRHRAACACGRLQRRPRCGRQLSWVALVLL